MAWKKATPEERQQYQAEFKANKERMKHIFEAEPEVDRWVKRKSLIFKIIAVYILVHGALSIITYFVAGVDEVNLGVEFAKPFFQIFWMYLFISPKGTWRFSTVLYFLGLVNLVLSLIQYIENIRGYFLAILLTNPVGGLCIVMELLYPYLLLAIAVYLTIPKKHRMLSERAEAIEKTYREGMQWQAQGGSMAQKAVGPAETQATAQTVGQPTEQSAQQTTQMTGHIAEQTVHATEQMTGAATQQTTASMTEQVAEQETSQEAVQTTEQEKETIMYPTE